VTTGIYAMVFEIGAPRRMFEPGSRCELAVLPDLGWKWGADMEPQSAIMKTEETSAWKATMLSSFDDPKIWMAIPIM
jgi:hypothetical protein